MKLSSVYSYRITGPVDREDLEGLLMLTMLALESLHGAAQVALDAVYDFDLDKQILLVDASTAVGRDQAKLLSGFLRAGLEENAVVIDRVCLPDTPAASMNTR